MTSTSFRLDIGKVRCTVVSDGSISVPGPLPPGSTLRPEERPREVMDVSCLVIDAGQRRILVDTGCGTFFQGSAGKLLENLREAGIDPASIDTIVYTHGHPDHVGGTFGADGKPIFPNARQVVSKKEWDCWKSPDTGGNMRMFNLARKNLVPVAEQFDTVEDNAEAAPGIKLIPAKGHTLGGVIIEISSGDDRMLCIGDLIHSQLEFSKPDYYSFLDSAPAEAVQLRTKGLEEIAVSGTLVFACHFPFPGIGRFVKKHGSMAWEPAAA